MASQASERAFLSEQMEALRLRIHALDMADGLVPTGEEGESSASAVGAAASSSADYTPSKGSNLRLSSSSWNAITVRARPKVA